MQGRRRLDAEQGFGVTDKACALAVDARFGKGERRLLIETAGENGFDGAIEDAVVSERAGAGGFQAYWPIPLGESQHTLCGAQALDDAIGEQSFDEGGAGRADAGGLPHAPVAIMSKEGLRFRRQVLAHGATLTGFARARGCSATWR